MCTQPCHVKAETTNHKSLPQLYLIPVVLKRAFVNLKGNICEALELFIVCVQYAKFDYQDLLYKTLLHA